MNTWVDVGALSKIVVVGLLTGAGLPALFACALWLLHPVGPAAGTTRFRPAAGPPRRVLAALVLAVVLAAIGWGIGVIVRHG
ncbi:MULTISPECIES: hypothetical protein [unclassified Streptomyces]|uniref:hypothetical protein n=1 Tax=unclassified Streptomyces TaxID=2593676 RepID=UPI001660C33A|nr:MULTISPECIES: hypothetical protein [unclassified Streptomyces]MBD0711527.1 hypothetical protein [Streptomyces sp. CBMA291]MBD0716531.1 hypothetical protein [Streptomyces sp. CBMA370]